MRRRIGVTIVKLFQYVTADLELCSNESDDVRIKGINGAGI